jgi:hypothetical protein
LSASAPGGWFANTPINFSYTVRNSTGGAMSIKIMTVAVRDPNGQNVDRICSGGTSLTLTAGQSWTCHASATTGYGSTGTYTLWADWEDYNGAWHQGQLGPNQTFTLTQPLAIKTPLAASAPGGTFAHVPITFTFSVKNNARTAVKAALINVPVRGPAGQNLDVACIGGGNVSTAAGAVFACEATGTFPYVGTYTFWADWLAGDGTTWHHGQLGPNQTIGLAATPALHITTPLRVWTPRGAVTGARIHFSFTLKNGTSTRIDTARIEVAVRGPAGRSLDVACSTRHRQIAPGASYACATSRRFRHTGTYTVWADWLSVDGHTWHQGQLGPNQKFTLH